MSNHPTEPAVTNRLAGESSPYLLLHQHNPVDWYPWGEEALRRASREDKPIFLSVGYSTCYWCHVMERESFADPRVAAVMNRDFVNIKLDREERPDLDEVYMTATQILTGQGGWPNSLFLTPKLEPFFAGTYFPPDDAHGRPGFRHVLEDLAQAWKERRTDVEEQAAEMAKAMRHFLEERSRPGAEPPGPGTCWRGVDSLARRFDREWGGFGSAPKFPTPSNLFLLLEMAPERPDAGEMLAATLDAMARGGIYDQLAGGFHRYATDREWKVPHFEKMLYDNGFLLELHAREHARTGDPQAARVARETAAFLGREMTSPEGALWSAIDAETGGHEGAYYVWTRAEIAAVLGEEDAAFAAPLLGFAGPPFFEGDRYVLHAPERWEEVARRRRLDPDELLRELAGPRRRLLEARGKRPRPATDDKVLADWNGMAIAGLAAAGRLLGEPGFIAQAVRAAEVVLGEMRPGGAGGSLMHVWRAGHARIPAFLADYAFLVRGLLALHEATGEARWLASAAELTDEQAARLADPEGGFFVAGASPDLLFRSKDPFDGATPAANAVAVLNLIELAERDAGGRREHWHDQATAALKAFAPLVEQHPEAVRMMAIAARRYRGEVPAPVEAARERAPGAGPLAMLEKEAEELVKVHLELGEEAGGRKEAPAPAGEAAEGAAGRAGAEVAWRPFRLVLEVAPGWHLQANPPSESFLVPTTLAAEGAELRRVSYPAGEPLRVAFSSRPVAAYQGRVELLGEVGLAAGRQNSPAPGAAHLRLTYQLCDDRRCLPPVTRSVLPS